MGDEADLVIVDMCRSRGLGHTAKRDIFAVNFTRAILGEVVVLNSDSFKGFGTGSWQSRR